MDEGSVTARPRDASRGLTLPSDRAVLVVGVGTLGALVAAVVAVDVLDLAGSRSLVGGNSGLSVWHYLFREGSPVEWVQAVLLLAVVFYAGVGAGSADAPFDRRRLLGFLAVGCALMVVEDTGNVSQTVAMWASGVVDVPFVVFRGPIFGVIGLLMVYGPWRYRAALAGNAAAIRALVLGYACYAMMVAGEVLNQLFPFYLRVGGWVRESLLGGRMVPVRFPDGSGRELGLTGSEVDAFFLMDYVYEEALELLGATLLLVGVLRLLRAGHDTDPVREVSAAEAS